MLDIGTKFTYNPTEDDVEALDGEGVDETCVILGYIYYEGDLFYTCLGETTEKQFDMYHSSAVNRVYEYEN